MVFDGAAYYGLPTASQASSSTAGQQWHASNNAPNQHGNPASSVNNSQNGKGRGKSIIQRPHSYDAPQQSDMNAHYGNMYASQPIQQQWPGYTMPDASNPYLWQQQAAVQQQQAWYGAVNGYGQQAYQSVPAYRVPSLPPPPPPPAGPPPSVPPPPMRHALPAKPQSFVTGDSVPAALPSRAPPTILKPMRPMPEQRSMDLRPQRPVQTESHLFHPNSVRASAPQKLFCDLCKIGFQSSIHLIAHQRNEHVKCCKHEEGCKFEGMPAVVELHEQDRHLVFRPGARREKTKPDGPLGAKIQGTNMSLDTEEDIAKWIEERKRKWPGAKNKELKLQRDLKRKAYDAASPAAANTQQQQVNKRGKFAKPNTPAQHPEGYQRAPRVWGQTQASTEEQTSSTVPSPAGDAPSPDDDEDAAVVAAQLTKVVVVNNDNHCAPGAEEESIIKGKEVDRNLDREIISNDRLATEVPAKPAGVAEMEDESDNDSAPEEIETAKQQREDSAVVEQEEVADQPSVRPTQEARPRPDCTAWITGGQCKFGKQCRYSHDPLKRGKPRREPPPPAPKNPFERGDLIGKLVHHEVRHEVSDLTQVIDFLARNDWLKNVELYPGHKKDLEGRINEVA